MPGNAVSFVLSVCWRPPGPGLCVALVLAALGPADLYWATIWPWPETGLCLPEVRARAPADALKAGDLRERVIEPARPGGQEGRRVTSGKSVELHRRLIYGGRDWPTWR
jgi:hypothetical protein